MKFKPHCVGLLCFLLCLLPAFAWAHVGVGAGIQHGSAFVIGLLHPFAGFDHLAAMVAVGIWSAMVTRKVWLVPLVFSVLLLMGGLIGYSDTAIPAVEPMIAASLLVLGLLVGKQIQLSSLVGAALVGAFAIFHGVAHGTEMPDTQAMTALGGMVTGTMALHGVGIALGHTLKYRNIWLSRLMGATLAVLGTGYLTGVL